MSSHARRRPPGVPLDVAAVDLGVLRCEQSAGALRDVELGHGVGEAYEYTDANYDVLGLVVEKVSGQTYATHIGERIFASLGMSHSFTDQTSAGQSGLAGGHRS